MSRGVVRKPAEWSEEERVRPEQPDAPPPRSEVADLLRLQQGAGNQAVARMLRGGARAQLARHIVCMAVAGESAAQKKKLYVGVAQLKLKAARGDTTLVESDATALKALATVGPDESIYVVAHSDGKLIWGQKPAQLAKLLFDNLPDGFHGRIKLVACHSAEKRYAAYEYKAALGSNTTYAQELALELFKLQQGAAARSVAVPSVHGRPGALATLDPTTGKRRAYPTHEDHKRVDDALKKWKSDRRAVQLATWTEAKDAAVKAESDAEAALTREVTPHLDPAQAAALAAAKQALDNARARRTALEQAARTIRQQYDRAKKGSDARYALVVPLRQADADVTNAPNLEPLEAAVQDAQENYDDARDAVVSRLKKTTPRVAELKRDVDAAFQASNAARLALSREEARLESDQAENDLNGVMIAKLQVDVGNVLQGKAADVGYAVADRAPEQPQAPETALRSIERTQPKNSAEPIGVDAMTIELPAESADSTQPEPAHA